MSVQSKLWASVKRVIDAIPLEYVPGEFSAMAREGLKDLRQTHHDLWFGRSEHQSELGSPWNPTPQIVTREMDGYAAMLESYAGKAPEEAKEAEQTKQPAKGMER